MAQEIQQVGCDDRSVSPVSSIFCWLWHVFLCNDDDWHWMAAPHVCKEKCTKLMKQQRECDAEARHNPEESAEWSKRHYDLGDDGEGFMSDNGGQYGS